MRFACFARESRSERLVKDEAIKKMASITIPIAIGMPDPTTNRFLKKSLKAEFTPIYISFYNSFTKGVNEVVYVWIYEVKTIFAYETFKKSLPLFFNSCSFVPDSHRDRLPWTRSKGK